MANKRQQGRRAARRAHAQKANRDIRHHDVGRPTPVQAIELRHRSLAAQLEARGDRFSALLAKVFNDEHRGQYLGTTSGLSDTEMNELRSLVPAAHQGFRDELDAATSTLRALLSAGDPLYTLAMVQMTTLFRPHGSYYEPTEEHGENRVELVGGLLSSQQASIDVRLTSGQMQSLYDEIDHIFLLLWLLNISRADEQDPAAELRISGAMHWMTLRGTSYSTHGADLASAVFAPYEAWFIENFGLTFDQILRVGSAAVALQEERMNTLMAGSAEFANSILDHIDTPGNSEAFPRKLRAELTTRKGRDLIGARAIWHVVEDGIVQACSFEIDELAAVVPDLPRDGLERALSALAITLGSVEPTAYTGLFDPNPLVERPFVESGGRYMLPVPGMLIRDPLAVFEGRLTRDNDGYPKSRAAVLDLLAVEYLRQLLPDAQTETHLYYGDAELDGLVIFDDLALVVEGKASPLSLQAHRGDVTRLVRDIGRSVEDAWTQGQRARDYIESPGDSVFYDDRGREKLRIPDGAIRRVLIVNPTMHDLASHAPQLARLRSHGLFTDGELPWSIYINDLRVIAETSDNAAVFLHYLTWRSRLPLGTRIKVIDELDLWGSYLLAERFGMLATDADSAILGNSTTDFDAYYDGLAGHGPARERPRKFLEEPLKSFVQRMAVERPPGWLEAAGVVLDMSIPELAFVCATIEQTTYLAQFERATITREAGRLALIALPRSRWTADELTDLRTALSPDSTLAVFAAQIRGRAAVVWGAYGKPVTFEMSDFEKQAQAAPEVSPFDRT